MTVNTTPSPDRMRIPGKTSNSTTKEIETPKPKREYNSQILFDELIMIRPCHANNVLW